MFDTPSRTSGATTQITAPEPKPTHLVLTLKGSSELEKAYCAALQSLQQILLDFEDQTDLLSLELFDWGMQWLVLHPTNRPITEEEAIARTEEQFTTLKKLLHNELDFQGKTVKTPYYDGEHLWDEIDLHLFLKISRTGNSPFTSCPFEAYYHPFAAAILEWLVALPIENFSLDKWKSVHEVAAKTNATVQNALIVKVEASKPLEIQNYCLSLGDEVAKSPAAVTQLTTYQLLARLSLWEKRASVAEEKLAATAQKTEEFVEELRETLKAEAAYAREYAKQSEEHYEERLNGIEKSYDDAAALLKEKIAALETQLAGEQNRSEQSQEQLDALKSEMEQTYANQELLQQERQKFLNRRINNIVENSEATATIFQNQIGDLRKDKRRVQQHAQELKQSVWELQRENSEHKQRMSQMEATIRSQASQISGLANQGGGGGGGCCIS